MSDLGSAAGTPPPSFDPGRAPSAATVLGGPLERADLLTHNPLNAVTGGIWRAHGPNGTAIAKLLTDGRDHTGPAGWAASADPSHWNWWEREARAYGADVPGRYRPDGVDGPRLLAVDRIDDGRTLLWLEDVAGTMPTSPADLAALATALGAAQGRLAGQPPDPWLSRGFLAAYAESKPVDADVFDDDAAWAHPLVSAHLAPLRDELRRLHLDRHRFYAVVARGPRTLCHLDTWPANVLRRPDGTFALLDWAFCGDGALGEDIGNLIPDSVFDLLVPVDALAAVAGGVEAGYHAGLAASGWDGDLGVVALATHASAAKYHWLAERLVRFADRATQAVYGGRTVDPDELYRARGAGLALLCQWAADARQEAQARGWWDEPPPTAALL